MTSQKIYKCLSSEFDQLQKKINRITKKLDKYNKQYKFQVLETKPEKVTVYDYRNLNDQYVLAREVARINCHHTITDVTKYIFEMEELKVGNYEIALVIDHGDNHNNIIHVINDNHKHMASNYYHASSNCNHCNINRYRSKTVILYDIDSNNYIQVGKSCLHEFIGIECYDIIKGYQEIKDIVLEEIEVNEGFVNKSSHYESTIDFLASSINQIKNNGYIKDETKIKAWSELSGGNDYFKYFDEAKEIINYFNNKDFEHDLFNNNIKSALSNEYTKQNGFIAYAYISYLKLKEKEIQDLKEHEVKSISEYQGIIKGKIEISNLKITNRITLDGSYGSTFLYIFKDEIGNSYKWIASNPIVIRKENDNGYEYEIYAEINDTITNLRGTIKDHAEYKGEKQTVLTRCKVII